MTENQPIFLQIIDQIETDIITDVYGVDDLIISTTQIAKTYMVNHTTAVKAISKLTDAGVLYKKRGIGMCVTEGAKEKIYKKRREAFMNQKIEALLAEAKTLGISKGELVSLIQNKRL